MIVCTLKHATEPDLVLPASYISTRMKTQPNYSSINITIPNGIAYADDIALRLDGWLEVSYNGVTFAYSDNLVSAPLHEGATSTSISINATGQFPSHTPQTITLEGVSYQVLNVDGTNRVRAKFNPNVTPTGTVIYDEISYIVESIVFNSNAESQTMEIELA